MVQVIPIEKNSQFQVAQLRYTYIQIVPKLNRSLLKRKKSVEHLCGGRIFYYFIPSAIIVVLLCACVNGKRTVTSGSIKNVMRCERAFINYKTFVSL